MVTVLTCPECGRQATSSKWPTLGGKLVCPNLEEHESDLEIDLESNWQEEVVNHYSEMGYKEEAVKAVITYLTEEVSIAEAAQRHEAHRGTVKSYLEEIRGSVGAVNFRMETKSYEEAND